VLVIVPIGPGGSAEHWLAEAERLAADDARLEAENSSLRSRVVELEGRVAALSEKVAMLAQLVFGTSSEKKKPVEPGGNDAEHAGRGDAESGPRRPRAQRRGSASHGRRDYSGLEMVEEIHDIEEGDRVCPDCGAPYVAFGEETSEQMDWQVSVSCGSFIAGRPIAGRVAARVLVCSAPRRREADPQGTVHRSVLGAPHGREVPSRSPMAATLPSVMRRSATRSLPALGSTTRPPRRTSDGGFTRPWASRGTCYSTRRR